MQRAPRVSLARCVDARRTGGPSASAATRHRPRVGCGFTQQCAHTAHTAVASHNVPVPFFNLPPPSCTPVLLLLATSHKSQNVSTEQTGQT
eukprot:43895-Chlamydomonas_euryale.AAC.6